MKKIFFIPVLFMVFSAFAQDLNNAEDLLYYKKFKSAEDLLNQILKNDPGNTEAWYLLSKVKDSDSEIDLKNSFQNAPASVKDDPYFLIVTGKILLDESKKLEAEKYFEQALEKTKYKKSEILLAVAKAQIASGNGDANQAIDLLNRAIKKDKHNPQLYTELGKAYRK